MSVGRNIAFGWLLALLVAALFVRLGFWQLERMHQKQAMLDAVHAVLDDRRPLPLAVAADPARGSGYDWSAGPGRFAALPAILLDNQGRGDTAGVRAYRVFQPASGTPLLVELGWLPLPGDRRLPEPRLPTCSLPLLARLLLKLLPPIRQWRLRRLPRRPRLRNKPLTCRFRQRSPSR